VGVEIAWITKTKSFVAIPFESLGDLE